MGKCTPETSQTKGLISNLVSSWAYGSWFMEIR
jgi:hypothetical protein